MPSSIRPLCRLPLTYWLGFWSLIILLLLSSVPAHAEWVAIGTTDNATVYADPDTIRRKGNLVAMWQLYDYKTVQTVAGNSHLSSKLQAQYDCLEERDRRLASTWFSGNMGNGNVVFFNNSDEGKWSPVAPQTVGNVLWKVACAKK
jgi:hypothetical protein